LRLDTANLALADIVLKDARIQVEAHSVQLLTATVAAASPKVAVHDPSDTAVQPQALRAGARSRERPTDRS
jgi:hypothetical protein